MRLRTIAFLATLSLLLSACTAQRIGQGNVMRDERMLVSFEGIEVGSAFNVELRPGPHEVVVESDKNLLPFIKTEVDGGILKIYTEEGIERARALNVYISMPQLTELKATGAADIQGTGTFDTDKLELDISGTTDLYLELNVEELDLEASGSTDMQFSGEAEKAKIELKGASDLEARDLVIQELDIELSGSSDAEVTCLHDLKAKAKGSSDLACHGQPDEDDVETADAAQVSLMR